MEDFCYVNFEFKFRDSKIDLEFVSTRQDKINRKTCSCKNTHRPSWFINLCQLSLKSIFQHEFNFRRIVTYLVEDEDKTSVQYSKMNLSSTKQPSALIKSFSLNELCNVLYKTIVANNFESGAKQSCQLFCKHVKCEENGLI